MIKTFEQMCKTAADYDQMAKGQSTAYLTGLGTLGLGAYTANSYNNQMKALHTVSWPRLKVLARRNRGKIYGTAALGLASLGSSIYGALGAYKNSPNVPR